MAQKWNLQDIRPAGTPKPVSSETPVRRPQQDIAYRAPRVQRPEPELDTDLASIDVIDGNSVKRKRVFVTTTIGIIIIGIGFFINVLLGGAEVTVYPKFKDISVQADFTTYAEPQVGELGYELLALEESAEKQVKAGTKEKVSLHSEGKIFVYNTKSTAPQRLIKNTRFESQSGLIFRIKESIEVPGAKKDASGALIPGSVVADVFSDSTGEQYNIAPGKFTLPGLKGTDQFESVYGESKASFTGGFEGEKYIIEDAELSTAKQALHIELRDKLLSRLHAEVPAGFVVYDEAVTFAFESLPSTEYGDDLATIKELARLQVPMFKESEFSMFLASKTIPGFTNDPVTVTDPKTITFSYVSPTTTISDIATYPSLDFTLKGNARVVWTFDEKKLLEELVGKKKTESPSIFSKYSSISRAQAEIRPFWATSFPDTTSKLRLQVIIGEK